MDRRIRPIVHRTGDFILLVIRLYPLINLCSSISRATALPTPFDFEAWVHGELFPTPGYSLRGEIKCYNLPYGGIGFASHILTYWSIFWLGIGRKPLPPFSELKHSWFDLLLGILSLLGSVPIAALNISACRHRWQFVLIAVWKLLMSLTLGAVSLHQSNSLAQDKIPDIGTPFYWLILYIAGVVLGMIGLLSVVTETFESNHNLRTITYVFGAITCASAALGILWAFASCLTAPCRDRLGNGWKGPSALGWGCATSLALFGVLAAFYSDWALAAIAHNWSGSPSSDNFWVYWTYFVAKKLPLLSQ